MPADDPSPLTADALFEHAACGLLVTGGDGMIRRANATFCGWVGYSIDELAGLRKLQELLTMGGRIFHQTHWTPLLHMQGSIAEVKLDIVHRQGHTIPVLLNAVRRMSGAQLRHEIAVFVATDRHKYEHELVLARKRAEELAAREQQAQQALILAQAETSRQRAMAEDRALFAEQMVGIVSHDLRNPLSAIKMGTYLLERGEATPNQRKVLGRINNSVGRAERLIADLLDFTQARIGQGLSLSRLPVQLHQLMSESVEELAAAYPGRQLEHRHEGEGSCTADADRLMQLIGNLVSNAMAYGAPDRPVVVASRFVAGGFEVSVHNEGKPIPAELMGSLFAPMVRGAGSQASRGVGLGLFIVSEIAKAHGGAVVVESSAEAGTTFHARFPAFERQANGAAAPAERSG
ncbi:MAG: sensory box histidine kinase [Polaromonas sp.]|nr:sensory box histidine kinase [Polaromonas sp.]